MGTKIQTARHQDYIAMLRVKVIANLRRHGIDAANMVNFTSTLVLAAGTLIGRTYPGATSHLVEDIARKEMFCSIEEGLNKSQDKQSFVPADMAAKWLEDECLGKLQPYVVSEIINKVITDAYGVLNNRQEHIAAIKLLALHAGFCIGLVDCGKTRQEILNRSFQWLSVGINNGNQSYEFKAAANS